MTFATVKDHLGVALADRGTESVIVRLVSNPGADLREAALHRMIDRFPDSEAIQDPITRRDTLPVTITERLVVYVAEHLRERLLTKHRFTEQLALDLVLQTRERATAGLAMGVTDMGLGALVRQLGANRRLTGSLVLRALCMGNVRFFEHALSLLTGVPLPNARVLIHDSAGNGLKAVWSKAKLPSALFPAVRAALDVIAQTEFDGRDLDAERYSRRIVERILTQYETFGVEFEGDDLDYLISRVNKLPPATLAVH